MISIEHMHSRVNEARAVLEVYATQSNRKKAVPLEKAINGLRAFATAVRKPISLILKVDQPEVELTGFTNLPPGAVLEKKIKGIVIGHIPFHKHLIIHPAEDMPKFLDLNNSIGLIDGDLREALLAEKLRNALSHTPMKLKSRRIKKVDFLKTKFAKTRLVKTLLRK